MKDNKIENTAPNNEEIKKLYEDAERAVYIALRARAEKSGLKFLQDLQTAQYPDKTARNAPEIVNRIKPLENQLDELRKKREELQKTKAMAIRQSEKITNSEQVRIEWAKLTEQINKQLTPINNRIKALTIDINNLYDTLNISFSDRADLVQTALMIMLELQYTPADITDKATNSIVTKYGLTTADELTAEQWQEVQATANWYKVINSVGKAINTLASPDALNRTTTSKRKATADDITEWLSKYGECGADFKVSRPIKRCRASDCYDTLEYKDNYKDNTKNGWYIVKHYKTIAPYQYIEDYTTDEDGESDINYIKSYNPFISNSADLERIEDLYKTADLTDRQRLFLQAFCKRCRVSADFKDCKDYAFKQIGISTESNKTTFFNRLKNRLKTATNK